ncbi:sigma-70 family RNA polymerase sigma factor [bacterium]|nr:sigma-70 family RNA polymerase sigma factor [bacterium]
MNEYRKTLKSFRRQQATSDSDERQIILLCQRGKREVYGVLVERYMKRAYFTALGFIGKPEAALDLSQDAFVRAFQAIKRFDPERRFFTWYYQILRNLCLNYLRDRARHARTFSDVDENVLQRLPDRSQDAARLAEQNETQKLVWEGLNSLKAHQKEIIMLKDFQDLSYQEIADLLDCPIGTVMSRLFTARKALKAKLEKVVS